MLKKTLIAISMGLVFSLTGCGGSGGSNSGASNIDAPTSIKGMSFRHSISSGAGGFAVTGQYVATMSSNSNTYVIAGDGNNVVNSTGTYTYSKNNNIGLVNANDSVLSEIKCTYTFSTTTSGSYICQSLVNAGVQQNGTFTTF